MKKSSFTLVAIMCVLTLLFTGCGSKKASTDEAKEIKIGGLAPLTGNVSVYGISASNGTKLAFDEANEKGGVLGKKIKFIVEDEKGDATEAVNAYNKLVNNEEVMAIIGDITSKPSAAVASASQKEKLPVITPTATAANVTTYGANVYRACFLDPFQGSVMAKFAKDKLSAKTAAVIYNTGDDYSSGIAEAFKKSFEKAGGKVVAYEGYGATDKDFKSQLTKIKGESPDVLMVPDYYNTVALVAAQVKEVGLKTTLLGADGWDGVLGSVQDPSLVEGAYFSNHYSPMDTNTKVQDFIKNYKAKFNAEPNALSALGYDAAKILIAAIEKAKSTDKDKVVKALKGVEIDGVTGKISFDENRNPIKSVTVLKLTGGKVEMFDKMNP
ncbi:MAG: amino acid-binding protein [Bacillales bacterium]|jgi:branched-chain amino acid transport system substrate-binding protein|nr:amino acid-binding protein [Bacillales bacterium]